jgi:hypothetical protein
MTRISWLACFDPADGTDRMCTYIGETADVVITGLPPGFAANAPMMFELPAGAAVHGVPPDERGAGRRLAVQLGGVLFTVFKRDAIELLLDMMATPRTFVTVPGRDLDKPRMTESRDPPTPQRFEEFVDMRGMTDAQADAALEAAQHRRARALEEKRGAGVYRIRADWWERADEPVPAVPVLRVEPEPLTREDVAALPDGALVEVTWDGGNGPHVYQVRRAGGAVMAHTHGHPGEPSKGWPVAALDFVGEAAPYQVVRRVEKGTSDD